MGQQSTLKSNGGCKVYRNEKLAEAVGASTRTIRRIEAGMTTPHESF
ncbi:hypothetical protein ACFOLK_18795 [Marinococcus halophilus]